MALYEVDFKNYTPYNFDDDKGSATNKPDYGYDPLDRKRRSPQDQARVTGTTRTLDDRQIPWVYTPKSYVKAKPEEDAPIEEQPVLPKVSRARPISGSFGGRTAEDARIVERTSPEIVGKKTTVTWEPPEMDVPGLDLPDFDAPEYDRRRVRQLTQEQAAPQIRKLRDTVQQAMASSYENPNVRAMTLRDALAGYGLGLEGALSGAQDRAMKEYATEYEGEYEEATRQHATDVQEEMAEFEAAWNDYLKGYSQTTSTENMYDDIVSETATYMTDRYESNLNKKYPYQVNVASHRTIRS